MAAKELRNGCKGHKYRTLTLRSLRPPAGGLRTLRLKMTFETPSEGKAFIVDYRLIFEV